jgi:adenylate kinase family enzyme
MKNLIINGASRSGKSTVAKRIAKKFNMSYIPFDSIVSTLENLYPCTGIKHLDDNKHMSKNLSVLLQEFIKHLAYEDIHYVIDLYQIYPVDLAKIVDDEKHLVVYFGYPNLKAEEKLDLIKKYAREKDWTRHTPDSQMIDILNLFISENQLMQEECKKTNYRFFDTGESFEEAIQEAEIYITNILTSNQ